MQLTHTTAILAATMLVACGQASSPPTVEDAGRRDAGADASLDGGVHDAAPTDAPVDASRDAGPPVPRDVDFRDLEHVFADPEPACASDLMRAINARAFSFVRRGSVPARWFLTERNAADPRVQITGPQIFPAMADLIASARYEVDFQTYVWEQDSQPAQEILAALTRLARNRLADPTRDRPVRARFLLDASDIGFGSQAIEDSMPALAGALEALALDPRAVTWEIGAFVHSTLGNLHVKTLVVDGMVAMVTGANPQHHHDYAEPWHDAGFVVRGEVALGMLGDFEDAWLRSAQWTCGSALGDPTACTRTPSPTVYRVLVDPALDGTCMPVMIAMRMADPSALSNDVDNPQDQAFLAAFDAATDHIRLQSPNLNDDAAKAGLLAAVRRGVRVDIILSKGFNFVTESLPGQGGPNVTTVAELYATLRAEGMSDVCDRLRIRWHSFDGIMAVDGNGPRASHTKYASVDDRIALAGTANMDTQSWNNSREVNVLVDDGTTTVSWDTMLFIPDFEQGIVVDECLP